MGVGRFGPTMTEVWVTGCGAITAAGPTSRELGEAMRANRSAIRPRVQGGGGFAATVGEIPGDPISLRLDRVGQLFVAAASEAWREAGLDDAELNAERVSLVEGSSLGRMSQGGGGAAFAQAHHIQGPVVHLSMGSVSAACAIGEAFEKIAYGGADVAVAGGAECPLPPGPADRPTTTAGCLPFDQRRRATVLGEGAGVVILESRDHALRRGAGPIAVLRGYGAASERHTHAEPDPSGATVRRAVEGALRENGPPGWIKAHGTGTRSGDLAEYQGLLAVFGYRLAAYPVTSIKPTIGHCLGASGGVETVAALRALEGGFIPATLGTTCVDPALPLYDVVLEARPCEQVPVLLLAESLGGRAVALLLGPIA